MTKKTRRQFLEDSLLIAAAAAAVPLVSCKAADSPSTSRRSDALRVGVVGVRGRGRAHFNEFRQHPDTEVVAICDADEGVIGPIMKAAPETKFYRDIRAMLDDPSIDIVSIAKPNHWHALGAIWAMQAGKHVYVEKPLSHVVTEGRQVVEVAAKTGRVLQCGTQARSSPATIDALRWLQDGGLGDVRLAVGLCYKRRKSIGKLVGTKQPPETCDYDLWTGPASLRPLTRENLHYDWHWDFNTGNGDVGNQGVHQMDIARWGLGLDSLPARVRSVGGRVGYDDDGDTPNTQVVLCDWGDKRLRFEVRGLETGPYRGAKIGVVFHGEGGYLVSASYTKVVAFDETGEVMKTFSSDGVKEQEAHFRNFVDAVKADDPGLVHAGAREGHLSAALCHFGNISHRLGDTARLAAIAEPFGESCDASNQAFEACRAHLVENGVDAAKTGYSLGPWLRVGAAAERFVGDHAEAANRLLTREDRPPYVVSETL